MGDARQWSWRLALPLTIVGSGCIAFPREQDGAPQKTARTPKGACLSYSMHRTGAKQERKIEEGVNAVCSALWDSRAEEVFAKAFDGTLASRAVGPDGALEMVDGKAVLQALREQAPTWAVRVFVVPRCHENGRTDYPSQSISLTPRRLDDHDIVDTFAHELSHLVRAPDPLGDDEQWFKDRGHEGAKVDTQQFASYFVGHALRCIGEDSERHKTIDELVDCAETIISRDPCP